MRYLIAYKMPFVLVIIILLDIFIFKEFSKFELSVIFGLISILFELAYTNAIGKIERAKHG